MIRATGWSCAGWRVFGEGASGAGPPHPAHSAPMSRSTRRVVAVSARPARNSACASTGRRPAEKRIGLHKRFARYRVVRSCVAIVVLLFAVAIAKRDAVARTPSTRHRASPAMRRLFLCCSPC